MSPEVWFFVGLGLAAAGMIASGFAVTWLSERGYLSGRRKKS